MTECLDAIGKFAYWIKAKRKKLLLVIPFEQEVDEETMKEISSKFNIRVICP